MCVYCKGPTRKQIGTKIKVVGMTKVAIPSPMHPIIPYNIVLLEDENGSRLPKKTMKDYKIGDDFILEKAHSNDAVSISKVKYDIFEAIKQSVGLLKDVSIRSDDKILIKPSIISAAYPYQAVNTNPEFLDALLNFLFEIGVKKENIIMAEQALIGSDSVDASSKAGVLEICKRHSIQFMDISKGPFEKIISDGYDLNVFKEALDRKIINAPIMKTNFQLTISGAVENLSRLVDEQTQRRMYQDNIDETLPKLAKKLNIFTIADATNGMQGQGPLALGEPAFLNLILSGHNPFCVDIAFCEIAMLPIPRYVGQGINPKTIEFVGNELDALKYPIKQPVPSETAHPDIRLIDGKACSACLSMMNSITSKLVGLRGDEINVVMGSQISKEDVNSRDRIVLLGDCVMKVADSLGISSDARISEDIDPVEQIVLMKKLLMTKGTPKITNIDRVKSKMKKLLSKVIS